MQKVVRFPLYSVWNVFIGSHHFQKNIFITPSTFTVIGWFPIQTRVFAYSWYSKNVTNNLFGHFQWLKNMVCRFKFMLQSLSATISLLYLFLVFRFLFLISRFLFCCENNIYLLYFSFLFYLLFVLSILVSSSTLHFVLREFWHHW